eukprot:7750653-Alexandrium_andersonii.AAC.1
MWRMWRMWRRQLDPPTFPPPLESSVPSAGGTAPRTPPKAESGLRGLRRSPIPCRGEGKGAA